MKKYTMETAVGVFVFIGLLCVVYLTVKLGKMEIIGGNFYVIYAKFDNVSGLKPDSSVEIAGVEIGRVGDIKLDVNSEMAVVSLKIKKDIPVQEDAIASVKTSGLIGDKYISITPGGSEELLKPGDTITDTESTLDIEDLIRQFVHGKV